jgi:peptide/nickel transport system substrate-binding protein
VLSYISCVRTTFAGALLCATTLSPALAGDPQKGGALRVLATADVDHFDPSSTGSAPALSFHRAVTRQLISFASSTDEKVRIVPVGDLAEAVPQLSADGLTYTFKLRKGVAWNTPGGARALTAQDFERGIKRMCNPALGSFALSYFVDLISGMSDFCTGFSKVEPSVQAMKAYIESKDISGIETPDDQTIVIHLTQQAGDFIYMLTLPAASPAPVEVLEFMPDGPDYRSNFVSSGPYTVESYTPDSSLRLVRNPAWDSASDPLRGGYVDSIDVSMGMQPDAAMQQLQSNDGDVTYDINVPAANLQMFTATGDEKLTTVSNGFTNYLAINTVSANNNSALQNLKVREALQYAIDKAAIVQQMGGSSVAQPLNGIFAPSILGYHNFDLYPTPEGKGDPEKAKALLAEAGYADNLKIKMPFRNQYPDSSVAQTIQASLKRAGIEVEMVPVTATDFYSKYMINRDNTRSGGWDIAPVGWSPDWAGGAARSVFQALFTFDGVTPQTYNYINYNNPSANELAKKAYAATSADQVAALWNQVDELIMKDAVVVPYTAIKLVLYHSASVENFLPYAPSGRGDWTNIWLNR